MQHKFELDSEPESEPFEAQKNQKDKNLRYFGSDLEQKWIGLGSQIVSKCGRIMEIDVQI